MNLVDWILNLAALFLWIDWRTGSVATRPQPLISLASALRETGRRGSRGWSSLGGAAALVILRPFFYYTVGSAVEWTPVMDLFAISLPFRSDMLDRMFVYSTVSFALTLLFYYGCLLLISAVKSVSPEAEVMRRFVRAQLGWLAPLPWYIKVVLPFVLVALAWAALVPLLAALEITPGVPRSSIICQQAALLALSALLAWKWFFIAIFLLYALNTYVYLGTHPVWAYLAEVISNILRPLSFLRFGKVDLAPFVAIAVCIAVPDLIIRPLVASWFEQTIV